MRKTFSGIEQTSPEVTPHLYGQSVYTEEARISSVNGDGETGQLYARESNWTTFSHHIQKYLKMD